MWASVCCCCIWSRCRCVPLHTEDWLLVAWAIVVRTQLHVSQPFTCSVCFYWHRHWKYYLWETRESAPRLDTVRWIPSTSQNPIIPIHKILSRQTGFEWQNPVKLLISSWILRVVTRKFYTMQQRNLEPSIMTVSWLMRYTSCHGR